MAPHSSASAGPVRRNFAGADGAGRRKVHMNVIRGVFIALMLIVVALSALAARLASQVSERRRRQPPIAPKPPYGRAGKGRRDKNAAGGRGSRAPSAAADSDGPDGRDRVYCMVPFIWNPGIYSAIMETWGRRCDVINFLADSVVGGKLDGDKITKDPSESYRQYWEYPEGTFPDNVVFVNMTRTWHDCPEDKKGVKKVCRHIWEKMWRSWVYVEENHLDQAEWFCKVDYDTFFFPQNVKYFVREKGWDPFREHHYFGHMIQHRQQGRIPMIVGAAVCWSRRTLHEVADVYRNMPKTGAKGERGRCEDRAQATEEASTSLCLWQHLNVSAEPARDDMNREYISTAKYKDVLTWNRTEQGEWWYWKGKPANAGQVGQALAVHPIGLHKYKTPGEIRSLEQHFFGAANNKFIKRLDPHTRKYVDKVRKAIGVDPKG